MTEALKPNPFSKALSDRRQTETERRSEAVANVCYLIEFLKSEVGVNWLKSQVKNGSRFIQEKWDSFFSNGHTTGIVLQPHYDIHKSIPGLNIDLRIILEGKSRKISQVYFGEGIDAYFPEPRREDGSYLSVGDLRNEEYQKLAVMEAIEKANLQYRKIGENPARYRCVIFGEQGGECECPFICFVSKTYSPEQLVDELGVGVVERLCSGFERAIQEG